MPAVLLAVDHEHAKWLQEQGETALVYIHTAEPGYTLSYLNGSTRVFLQNGGKEFRISGTGLYYKRSGSSFGSTVQEYVSNFTTDLASLNDGWKEWLAVLAGRMYDHANEDGDFYPNPVSNDIIDFLEAVSGTKTAFDDFKDSQADQGRIVSDDDIVDRFLKTKEGSDVVRYFLAFHPNARRRTVRGYFIGKYQPVDLPVGTLVEGIYGMYGIPTPPNLKEVSGGIAYYGNSEASPYMKGERSPNFYGRVSVARSGNYLGQQVGSDFVTIQQRNLPKVSLTGSTQFTPQGSVTVADHSSTVNTNSKSVLSDNEMVWAPDPDGYTGNAQGDYWLKSNGDTAGSYYVPKLNFIAGKESYHNLRDTKHTHTVSLNHGHSATFSGTQSNISISSELNSSSSQSNLDVRQSGVCVQKYVVYY